MKFIKNFDLKTLVTLIMTIALVIGFFKNSITSEQFVPFVTMVFIFYFTKKKEENNE